MSLIRKDTDYAVRALLYLALHGEDGFLSTATLAEETGLPASFLRHICSKLIKAGILESREGAGGGVRLAARPEDVNLLALIELFHERLEISECRFRKTLCPNRSTCVLRRRILDIERNIAPQAEAITLQSLLDDLRNENEIAGKNS